MCYFSIQKPTNTWNSWKLKLNKSIFKKIKICFYLQRNELNLLLNIATKNSIKKPPPEISRLPLLLTSETTIYTPNANNPHQVAHAITCFDQKLHFSFKSFKKILCLISKCSQHKLFIAPAAMAASPLISKTQVVLTKIIKKKILTVKLFWLHFETDTKKTKVTFMLYDLFEFIWRSWPLDV